MCAGSGFYVDDTLLEDSLGVMIEDAAGGVEDDSLSGSGTVKCEFHIEE